VLTGVVDPTTYREEAFIKNITQDVFEIEDFNLTDYDCGDTGSTASKLLTSAPSPLPIGDLTSVHVSCLTTSYTVGLVPKQEWTIETYLNGVFVAQTTESVDVPTNGIIGEIVGGKYDISNYRFDFDSSTGYDEVRIYVRDIANPFTQRSETKTFKLNDACEKDITLSWYNEFGVQDSFTMLGNINRVGKYTDSTFRRARPVNPLSTDVGDLVYKSSYNYEYSLFSDRMPESSVQWLSKMLINKRVAIQSKQEPVTYTGGATSVQLTSPVVGVNQYGLPADGGNGFMYVPPFTGNDILKINISTGAITSFGTFAGGQPKWFCTEVAPNGKIYCIPFYDDNILVIDPSNDTTATLALPTSLGAFIKWKGSAITASGVIYSAPFGDDCDTVLKIVTSTDTVSEFGSIIPLPPNPNSATKYTTGVLSTNGSVYFTGQPSIPYLKIDTGTDAITSFGNQGLDAFGCSRSYKR